jgi:uncharacterized membrane protein
MREDFKYPYRVITQKEEIEGNKALGFLLGATILLPFILINIILGIFQGMFSKFGLLAIVWIAVWFLFGYYVLPLIF